MSSLFIGWLARAGQKASPHLRHPGPADAEMAGKCRPVLEPAGVEKRLVVAGATCPRLPRRERYVLQSSRPRPSGISEAPPAAGTLALVPVQQRRERGRLRDRHDCLERQGGAMR